MERKSRIIKAVLAFLLVGVVLATGVLTGCVRRDASDKAGPIVTRDYDNTGFTSVEVGSALKVDITPSDTYSLKITGSQRFLERLQVSQTGDSLKITMDSWMFGWWWGSDPKIAITMPAVKQIVLTGASAGSVTGFKSGEPFNCKVNGASKLELEMETGAFTADVSGASNIKGRLKAAGTSIELSGASDVDFTGSGGDIKLNGSGASSASFLYYPVGNADVVLSGASSASLDISGQLDAVLSGASNLKYTGDPKLGRMDITGASDLTRKN